MLMHKLGLETWSSFSFLFESYRETWVVTSKSKSRSDFDQVRNAFQTLFFPYFVRDIQNSGKRLRAACFYTVPIKFIL